MACPSYQAAAAMEDPRDDAAVAFRGAAIEGRDLGDENLIRVMTAEATERALDLERFGVKFRKTGDKFFQVSHPGHSFPRNLVIKGADYSMMFHLRRKLKCRKDITLMEDAFATRLVKRGGRVAGAVVVDLTTGEVHDVRARAVIIATGGYPELWLRTDTTPELTGAGQARALDAGAELIDMEMMLYYPTSLTAPEEIAGTLGVVGGVGVPAGPHDPDPRPHEHPDRVGVPLSSPASVGIEPGRPRRSMPGAVGEDAERIARSRVDRPSEVDRPPFAGLLGDRRGTGLGAGVLTVDSSGEDGTDLGHDLGKVDLADPGHEREQHRLLVSEQERTDGPVEICNGHEQRPQQRHLGGNQLGERLRRERRERHRSLTQTLQKLAERRPQLL